MQNEAISALRPGVALSAAFKAAMNRLQSKAAHLEKKMTKNVGFLTGIEFREGSMQLNAKNETRVRSGMTFIVALGFEGLEDKEATDLRGQTYALFLADTVIVNESGPPDVYTDKAPKVWTEVSYYLKDEEDVGNLKVDMGRRGEVEVLENRTRNAGKGISAAAETSEASRQPSIQLNAPLRAAELVRSGDGRPSPLTRLSSRRPFALRPLSVCTRRAAVALALAAR